mgnify:CR=1 FL=1
MLIRRSELFAGKKRFYQLKTITMKTLLGERFPIWFDAGNLHEDEEICIDYDANGNPTRIFKRRRPYGWAIWLLGIVAFLLWLASQN